MAFPNSVNRTISINASASKLWRVLTNAATAWVTEGGITVSTDWQVGSPITFSGTLHGFELNDKGIILQLETEKALQYSYWSSLSRLPDTPDNYSVVAFRLAPEDHHTVLHLTHGNFPLESEYQHSNFYWNATLYKIKQMAEQP